MKLLLVQRQGALPESPPVVSWPVQADLNIVSRRKWHHAFPHHWLLIPDLSLAAMLAFLCLFSELNQGSGNCWEAALQENPA